MASITNGHCHLCITFTVIWYVVIDRIYFRILQAQIRETMESAFWDGIVHGLLESPPEYGRVVSLVGEIRKESTLR